MVMVMAMVMVGVVGDFERDRGGDGDEDLQLNIELFFLFNDQILFNDFFCFQDQSSLKGLDLLKHFKSFGITAFQLTPSVHIHRVFEFF